MTTDHKPSRTCYQRGCRLPDCVAVNYRYEKGLNYDLSQGRRRQVDAQQARAHVDRLRALGWFPSQIAAASGVARSVIYALPERREIRSHIARALLALPIAPPPPPKTVDATGTIRRIRALAAIGHTLRSLCDEAGWSHSKIENLAAGNTTTVSPETAATITAIYKRLSHKPGPSKQTKTFAQKHGWHGPLAWDVIDDPNCEPETEGRTDYQRRHKAAIDLELVAMRTSQGRTAEQIAAEIGCHVRSVTRARRRAEQGLAA